MVKDISQASAEPRDLRSVNGILFFSADDGVHGRELWRSDGSAEGTQLLSDLNPGSQPSNPSGFVFSGGSLYFSADNGGTGMELWRLRRLPGDIDFNDHVDLDDLNIVRDWFGAEGVEVAGDVDRDGDVDLPDLNIVLDWFGASLPFVTASSATAQRTVDETPSRDFAVSAVSTAFEERVLATDALFSLHSVQTVSVIKANAGWNKRATRGR